MRPSELIFCNEKLSHLGSKLFEKIMIIYKNGNWGRALNTRLSSQIKWDLFQLLQYSDMKFFVLFLIHHEEDSVRRQVEAPLWSHSWIHTPFFFSDDWNHSRLHGSPFLFQVQTNIVSGKKKRYLLKLSYLLFVLGVHTQRGLGLPRWHLW